jgi:hypothetical protein
VIGGGNLSFVIDGFELPVPAMMAVSAKPHADTSGDFLMQSEGIPEALREKGAFIAPIGVVKNNRRLKRKKGDGARSR